MFSSHLLFALSAFKKCGSVWEVGAYVGCALDSKHMLSLDSWRWRFVDQVTGELVSEIAIRCNAFEAWLVTCGYQNAKRWKGYLRILPVNDLEEWTWHFWYWSWLLVAKWPKGFVVLVSMYTPFAIGSWSFYSLFCRYSVQILAPRHTQWLAWSRQFWTGRR